ncbi:MAG: SIR2 family protein [Deltaproteobacteria bacterium]|nr:SIR2 family protein [Deltaproteobacteria bacterium]
MRFNDYNVDIDEELITALRNGTLVVFVGAGVSAMAYENQPHNTYYPTFKELVHEIAKRIDKPLSNNDRKLLKQGLSDRVLGEWEKFFGDVHAIAAKILQENEAGQRIDLHRAIIRLFPEESVPEIVTTNFDNLLIRALDKEGLKDNSGWKIHEAPSLPPANTERFKGICFLHGRATEPQEMILTDRDIGRAYMDEAWALKFSHELFRNFNVLFVGYALDDPPLRYLSLALEGKSDKKRWVMLDDKKKKEKEDWSRRGVIPIWYPAKQNDRRALERTISDWAENNRSGYIDRRNLLSGWGQTDPNQLAPHDLDCAKYYLQMPELLRDFAENIKNEYWFDNLVKWGHFDFTLKKSGEFKEADNILAQVLIKWLLQDPHKWLVKLLPYRKTMNETSFEIFCREFEKGSEQYNLEINDLRMLLEFFKYLIENDSNKSFSLWIGKILKRLVKEGFPDDAVWLFIATNRTNLDIRTAHNYSYLMAKETGGETKGIYPLELEMEFNSQDSRVHRSQEYIKKIFLPEIKTIGSSLLSALTNELFYIRMSLKRMGGGKYSYLRCKTIEHCAKGIHRSSIDNFFIVAMRDLWEALLREAPDQAIKIYHSWSEIDDEIFNRMALHAARLILENSHAE